MYLYAEIEKKSTRVKIYNAIICKNNLFIIYLFNNLLSAIEFNFHLGLLRILKEFPILSVRSMLVLENLVHCLLKKCLIEVLVKMGFNCGVFFLK